MSCSAWSIFLLLNLVRVTSSTIYIYRTEVLPDAKDSHCVFYDEYDGIDATFFLHTFNSYCFRLDVRSTDSMFASAPKYGRPASRTSFQDLEKRNVTISDLLAKSIITIDDLERYQSYLLGHDTNEITEQYLFTCPAFHFGSFCQFEFVISRANLSFGEILNDYISKIYVTYDYHFVSGETSDLHFQKVLANVPCYTHLHCRTFAGEYCLDWREICNGVTDCFESNIDEKYCFELELTECAFDEYRCGNGMQCIPSDFFRDTETLPDCLDKSDETIDHIYNPKCFQRQRLNCTEYLCASGLFSCADGTCSSWLCGNRRTEIFFKALTSQPPNMTKSCWEAMQDMVSFTNSNESPSAKILEKARQSCPRILEYPAYSVANGDVRLIFDLAQPHRVPWLLPNAICFNVTLCPFYQPTELNYSIYSSCRSFHQISSEQKQLVTPVGFHFLSVLRGIFSTCATVDQFRAGDRIESADLYQCTTTNKYIAKTRLLDGVNDCRHKDDENFTDSCSLRPINGRFTCDEHPSTQCFSPLMSHRDGFKCLRSNFDRSQTFSEPINFQTLCDGFEDRVPMFIDGRNQTDETDCAQVPCNTTYTHCNHYWNCPNGLDELGCYSETIAECGRNAHRCLRTSEKGWMCLNLSRAADGYVDCRGGMDERMYCRRRHHEDTELRYRCSHGSRCSAVDSVCTSFTSCDVPINKGDSCQSHWGGVIPDSLVYPCTPRYEKLRSQYKNYVCLLYESDKPKVVYFSLKTKKNQKPKVVELANTTPLAQPMKDVGKNDWVISNDYRTPTLMKGLCYRGFPIFLSNTTTLFCLCSPDSYGNRCQYQNQRVLVTVQFAVEADLYTVFAVVFLLVDPETEEVESHEQLQYLPIRDCRAKFTFHLLYHTRPKRPTTNYLVRIEIYDADNLQFRDSWIYSLRFAFLPVHRLAIQVFIPAAHPFSSCSLRCGGHGRCTRYTNDVNKFYCRCEKGWSGLSCTKRVSSNCAPTALCAGFSRSALFPICVCRVGWFGSRCYLQHNACIQSPCLHNGRCVPSTGLLPSLKFTDKDPPVRCLCSEDHSGNICQYDQSRIQIVLDDTVIIPPSILVHFVTVPGESPPSVMSMIAKVPYDQNSVVVFTSVTINLIFIVINNGFYLLFRQADSTPSRQLEVNVSSSSRCLHIKQLLADRTILALHPLHRAKSYHSLCRRRSQLTCFHDSDTFMCLCNAFDRNADCFNFDYTTERNCRNSRYCLNGGQCSQDRPSCPTRSLCNCPECFYGRRCQFSTSGLGLSLDAIIGYHIQPGVSFTRQPLAVKISGALVAVLCSAGVIGNSLAVRTFSSPKIRNTGCGIYLLASSNTALLISVLLALKFIWLFLAQSGSITDDTLLHVTCIFSLDFVIRVCLSVVDWSSACVAIERCFMAFRGVRFDKRTSQSVAKWIVVIIPLATLAMSIHDPLHRELLQDTDERRRWCMLTYSARLQTMNSVMLFAHFLSPFFINLGSAFWIIINPVVNPSTTQKKLSLYERLGQQLQDHKRLLISCWSLVILALPRLIIALQMGCLKSQRNPYLFLSAYFISFMPPALVFVVFIVPSSVYMADFKKRIRCFR